MAKTENGYFLIADITGYTQYLNESELETPMSSNDYHFTTHWRMENTTLAEVSEILGNGPDLARWWPSVYLGVKELEPGDPKTGIGKVIDLYTKGWLPYTLRWQFRVTESNPPRGFALEAWGDFVGRGEWTFTQEGDAVHIVYDWNIRADKPLLRAFSFIMKPIFSANHHWAMQMGEQSLRLELARRHAKTPAERALIPAPPAPTRTSPVPVILLLVAGGVLFWISFRENKTVHG